jgi:hypothetical protein
MGNIIWNSGTHWNSKRNLLFVHRIWNYQQWFPLKLQKQCPKLNIPYKIKYSQIKVDSSACKYVFFLTMVKWNGSVISHCYKFIWKFEASAYFCSYILKETIHYLVEDLYLICNLCGCFTKHLHQVMDTSWSELAPTNALVEDEPVQPVLRMNILPARCVFFFHLMCFFFNLFSAPPTSPLLP